MRQAILGLAGACLVFATGPATAQSCNSIPVCTLKTFIPDPSADATNADSSPSCDMSNPPSAAQNMQFQNALALAQNKVQADLCRVNQFFIDPVPGGDSWGRWENPLYHHGNIPGSTQITVNVSQLDLTFSQLQDKRLTSLNINATYGVHTESIPHGVDANTVGLLYVLAHELGHIRWHKAAFIGEFAGCSDPKFYSWSDAPTYTTRTWTKFNSDFGTHADTSIKKPKDVQSSDDLNNIYGNGFVTALSSANPEEDFVESYAIWAVTKACNSCKFSIEIPVNSGNQIALNNDRNHNQNLKNKFDCMSNKHVNY